MTTDTNTAGREPYSDQQYSSWLDDMAPFLKLGQSLYHAIEKADLIKHKDSIYRKFRLNDWFCEKIEAYQKYPGEIVNSIFTRLVMATDDKMKRGTVVSDEEWRNLRFFAIKHKSCQPFFANRQEVTATGIDTIGTILDSLDETTNYEQLAQKAGQQLEALKNQINPVPVPSILVKV
jgi:hypothetical protein